MSPPPDPSYCEGAERGVSINRGHPILCRPNETLLGIDSRSPSPWSADPRSGQPGCKPFLRAPVGSKTETDDDCRPATFHRGRFRVRSSLLDSTIAWENPPPGVGSLYMVVNRAKIFFI